MRSEVLVGLVYASGYSRKTTPWLNTDAIFLQIQLRLLMNDFQEQAQPADR